MRVKLVIFPVLIFVAGCASAPISTTLPAVMSEPGRFRNEYIEIAAMVIENPPPRGDYYRTWSFTIGSMASEGPGEYRIMAGEEGFNPSTIDKAYRLVEDARKAGEPLMITGRLRVGPYGELVSGIEIELVSVRFRGTEINTDKGPFVGGYYNYPYSYRGPIFLHFGSHHHYGHGRHHW